VPGQDLLELKHEKRKVLFLFRYRSRLIMLTWNELFSLPILRDPNTLWPGLGIVPQNFGPAIAPTRITERYSNGIIKLDVLNRYL
jgi:hypothetical protein